MCFVCRMDFSKWNKIAKGEQRNLKKCSELEVGKLYLIEDIRKTTTKYGDKVTVNLEGDIYCYLPVKLSEALLDNDQAGLLGMQAELQTGPINLRRFEARGRLIPVEFVPDVPDMMTVLQELM